MSYVREMMETGGQVVESAVAAMEEVLAGPVVGTSGTTDADAGVAEERIKILSEDTMSALLARANRKWNGRELWRSVLRSTYEAEADLPKDPNGFVICESIMGMIDKWEELHGGPGSATQYPLTREANDWFVAQGHNRTIGYDKVRELVGKNWGITLDEVRAAILESLYEEQAGKDEWRKLVDLQDDGARTVCVRCRREFQPRSLFVLDGGKPVTDRSGRQIRRGAFLVLEESKDGKDIKLPHCRRCQDEMRMGAPDLETRLALKFESSDDADARIERRTKAKEFKSGLRTHDKGAYDSVRIARGQRAAQEVFRHQSRFEARGVPDPSKRDRKRRSGSGGYVPRHQDDD